MQCLGSYQPQASVTPINLYRRQGCALMHKFASVPKEMTSELSTKYLCLVKKVKMNLMLETNFESPLVLLFEFHNSVNFSIETLFSFFFFSFLVFMLFLIQNILEPR